MSSIIQKSADTRGPVVGACFGDCHMDSKLACRGIWFLPESNPVSPRGTSIRLHLRVKNEKILSPGKHFFQLLDLESSLKNLNDYLLKSFCVAPVRPCFRILRHWENDNDHQGTFPIQPISVEGLNSFYKEFRGERPNESLLRRI